MDRIACPACGALDQGRFCSACGAPLRPPAGAGETIARTAQVLLGAIVECLAFNYELLFHTERTVRRIRTGAIHLPTLIPMALVSVSATAFASLFVPNPDPAAVAVFRLPITGLPEQVTGLLGEIVTAAVMLVSTLINLWPAHWLLARTGPRVTLTQYVVLAGCVQFSAYPFWMTLYRLTTSPEAPAGQFVAALVLSGITVLITARGMQALYDREYWKTLLACVVSVTAMMGVVLVGLTAVAAVMVVAGWGW